MSCNLGYIPARLHMELKPIEPTFQVGEELYYRVDPEKCKKPYDTISLYYISHNRSFQPPSSTREDVLFNISPTDPEERYTGKDVVVLSISNLGGKSTFIKEFKTDDEGTTVLLTLLHNPVDCMYPHSVFEIKVNDDVVNKENYKETLNVKPLKTIRSLIRQELTSMIQSGVIDSTAEVEILLEP